MSAHVPQPVTNIASISSPEPSVGELDCHKLLAAETGHRWIVPTLLALLIALIVVTRLHTYHEPLERDITSYAVYANELLHGRHLYSDIWDHKPPGQFITYCIAQLLAGYGLREIYLLNVVVSSAALVGAYAAGKVVGGPMAGLAAAAIWATASGSMPLEGNQPNTELSINAWTMWAVALLWSDRGDGRWVGRAIAAGAMFAAASLYKHSVVVIPIFLALAMLIDPPAGNRARAVNRVAVVGSIGMAIWTVMIGYFAATGRLSIFMDALFRTNVSYAGSMGGNLLSGLSFENLAPPHQTRALYPPAIAAVVAGLVRLCLRPTASWPGQSALFSDSPPPSSRWKRLPVSIHAIAWAVGTWLAVTMPGKYFPHYYQLWLPAVCVGGGWAIVQLASLCRVGLAHSPASFPYPSLKIALSAVPALLVLGSIIALEAPTYALSPEQWSREKYGEIFIAERQLGNEINTLLLPGERVYNFGNEMGLYFYSRRTPPVGMMASPLLRGYPISAYFNELNTQQLSAHPPELVIISKYEAGKWAADDQVFKWLLAHYRGMPQQPSPRFFNLGYLIGGELQKRLGISVQK